MAKGKLTGRALLLTALAILAALSLGAVVYLALSSSEQNTDGKRVVFVSRRDFPKDSANSESAIYSMNADGSDQTRLTEGNVPQGNPSWSRDGKQVVFVLKEDVYLMKADGLGRIKLAVRGAFPTFSPNGSQVLFTRQATMTDYELYVMDTEGQDKKRLATGHITQFQWSPDGKRIAYTQGRSGPADKAAIHLTDPTGSTDAVLPVPESGDANSPCWSPDGKMIAFGSFTSQEKGELYLYDLASMKIERLAVPDKIGAWRYLPKWSPDSRYIAFLTKNDPPWLIKDAPANIAVVKADGTGAKLVTTLKKGQFASDVSWADGSLLFTLNSIKPKGDKNETTADIYLVSLDGKLSRLTTTSRDFAPDWPN